MNDMKAMKQFKKANWRTNFRTHVPLFRWSYEQRQKFYLIIVCYVFYEHISDSEQQEEDNSFFSKETLQYLSSHNSSAS